jgi:hypothetical protein
MPVVTPALVERLVPDERGAIGGGASAGEGRRRDTETVKMLAVIVFVTTSGCLTFLIGSGPPTCKVKHPGRRVWLAGCCRRWLPWLGRPPERE